MMPTVVELEHVYLDQAEHRLRKAIADAPTEDKKRLTELAYLTYEAINRGYFGNGSFSIAITCNAQEFIVGVKKEA